MITFLGEGGQQGSMITFYYYYYYYKVNFHTVIEIQVLQFTGNNIIHQFSLFH